MNEKELVELARDLIDHLDYCGWGDRWEREVSEDLRKRADRFIIEHPKEQETPLLDKEEEE